MILDDEGNCAKILFVFRDITYRKEANERFISKILEAEDRERKRIAKELHDSLGQNLSARITTGNGHGCSQDGEEHSQCEILHERASQCHPRGFQRH